MSKHSINPVTGCTIHVGGVFNPDCRASSIEVENLSHRTYTGFTECLRMNTTIKTHN